ncbi:hypothetical protein NESM_000357400 [Novymonas esmeraldas]|uniref:Uncharacterized protein n=1 Tax=Novymonas esmeraldas TaxID=1808958 RepID=A0AAW0EML4_9TRYP
MGGVCSAGEDAKHHRENRKNRINPTESYDTWQRKMLLDIGSDPLAVIRDFPRMTVCVGTEARRNSVSDGCNPSKDTVESSKNRHQQPHRPSPANPLAPPNSVPLYSLRETDAAAVKGSSKQQQRRRSRLEKAARPALHIDSHTTANASTEAWVSPTASPLLPPRPPLPPSSHPAARGGGAAAQRPSLREPFREHDAFAARMRRVREAVLLLSELCGERTTFGAAFDSAWDRLVSHGSPGTGTGGGGRAATGAAAAAANTVDSDAASEFASGLESHQASASKNPRRQSIPLDVHQILLNACVDSGMLVLLDDTGALPTIASPPLGSALPRLAASAPAPLSLRAGTPPALVNRNSRQSSLSVHGPQTSSANPTTSLTAAAAAAAVVSYGAADTSDSPKRPEKSDAPQQQQQQREPVATSASSAPASTSRPGRSGSQVTSTPAAATAAAAALMTTPSRYMVRSATFHLMQFATQGVMFFPVQRLKHVLWMPWASHMQDVDWTIHISLADATPADLIARRQHQQSASVHSTTSLPPPHGDLAAAAAAAADERRGSLPATAAAAGGGDGAGDGDEWGSPATGGSGGGDGGARKSQVVVIRHLQTGRHYVEKSDRKTTPRYELDWACSIRVDQDILMEVFAPFQQYAATATISSVPLSPLRHLSVAQEMTTAAASTTARQPGRLSDDEHETVDVDASPSEAPSENAAGSSFPQRPAGGPTLLSLPPPTSLDAGVRTSQQPQLLQREVVRATVEVIAARVEKPQHTLCVVSSTWRQRKEELDYVLEQQYKVQLDQVDELSHKAMY